MKRDGRPLVRLEYGVTLRYEVLRDEADFIFNIEPARTEHQTVGDEKLVLSPVLERSTWEDTHRGRWLRVRAPKGTLTVDYSATVTLAHAMAAPASLAEVPMRTLPGEAMPYVLPSRYCQSDLLFNFAQDEFGKLAPGYARVAAICEWVRRHITFTSGASDCATTAVDTLLSRRGVCRDFAHLMIALCRALNIPARMATGTDFGCDPEMGPPDFHAYVEAYLGDRWWIFDPSGTAIPAGFIRLGTGRDAAEVAFATIFGYVECGRPDVRTTARANPAAGEMAPQHMELAISTSA